MIKIVSFKRSMDKVHKFVIVFEIVDKSKTRRKTVKFGRRGYSDYTIHKDPERKKRYIQRHHDKENWNDPVTPGALSRWILWNKTSLHSSFIDFKKRFNIK